MKLNSKIAILALASAVLFASSPSFAEGFTRITPANKPTYTAIATAYAAYATPTDLACIRAAATRTVQITGAFIAPGATAFDAETFFFIKRSTFDTTGTRAAIATSWVNDSTQAAPTAQTDLYSVIPGALGTVVGSYVIPSGAAAKATVVPNFVRQSLIFPIVSGTTFEAPIVLQPGSTEEYCINFNGAALPAGWTATVGFQWNEL